MNRSFALQAGLQAALAGLGGAIAGAALWFWATQSGGLTFDLASIICF